MTPEAAREKARAISTDFRHQRDIAAALLATWNEAVQKSETICDEAAKKFDAYTAERDAQFKREWGEMYEWNPTGPKAMDWLGNSASCGAAACRDAIRALRVDMPEVSK